MAVPTAGLGRKRGADMPWGDALWEELASGRRWCKGLFRRRVWQGPARFAFPPPTPGIQPGPEQVLTRQLLS